MQEKLLNKYSIKQIGYYVKSIEETAEFFVKQLGSGPFVDLGTNPPASCTYQGEEIDLRSRCALGQLGDMQIELIEVSSEGPDPYKEIGYGLNHYCIWADDVDAVAEELAAIGVEPAMVMISGQGLKVVYFDTRELLGHYLEVNAPIDRMWQAVKMLTENSDGSTPCVLGMEAMMAAMKGNGAKPKLYEGDLKDYFKGRDFVHQVGFYAPDWKKFAQEHHDLFGSGPFYHTTNTFGKLIYRGEEVDCSNLKFHACYGGWGSHSIEVVQQEGDAPTMFTEGNDMGEAGFNHIHMFVEDLEQAIEACEYNNIPIVTIGYADVENALKKAAQTGADVEEIKARASKPSFMVVDMREQFGCMVQLIGPSAKMIHNLLISSRQGWDGETDLFRKLG